jgi:hypothetical protein
MDKIDAADKQIGDADEKEVIIFHHLREFHATMNITQAITIENASAMP